MEKLKNVIKNPLWILYLILNSCTFNIKDNSALKTENYISTNFITYKDIFQLGNDSIRLYADSMLKTFTSAYSWNWYLDSMICLNSKKDKLVAILIREGGAKKGTYSDDVEGVFGKKINDQWYFFAGGTTLILPREMFGFKDIVQPSRSKLSQIARKEYFESALIKNDKGEYIVNDKWVDAHFYYNGMCGHCKTKEQYDSTHWYKIIHKWKEKIDTNEYKPLRRNKMNSPAI